MQDIWYYIFGLLLVFLVLLIRAFRKSIRLNKLILVQSKEIQKQNRELEHRNKLLQELNVEKQQIIGVVSHDLKGPFNRIFALVQLMLMTSENLTLEQKEYLGKMHQIVADGLSMVRNLLDNRKLEDRGIDMWPELLNLSTVLNTLIKQYQSLADKKNILIQYMAPPSTPIYADKVYLTRIFENLVSNAIKFSPADKHIFVTIADLEGEIEITVKDEGPGINKEDQLKLYQKFQRLAARPTGGESSTGLGLSIVKTMVGKMDGKIQCESEEEKGAKFIVLLPKKLNEAKPIN